MAQISTAYTYFIQQNANRKVKSRNRNIRAVNALINLTLQQWKK